MRLPLQPGMPRRRSRPPFPGVMLRSLPSGGATASFPPVVPVAPPRSRFLPPSFTSRPNPAVPTRPGRPSIPRVPKPRDPQHRRTTPTTRRHGHPGNPGPPGRPQPAPAHRGIFTGCVHEGLSGAGLTNWPDFVVRSAASTPDAGVRANVRAHVSGNSRTQPLKCQGSCQGIGRPCRASFGVNDAGP